MKNRNNNIEDFMFMRNRRAGRAGMVPLKAESESERERKCLAGAFDSVFRRNIKSSMLLFLFSLLLALHGCLKYDKETIHILLDPHSGKGEISYFVENITSDEKAPEKQASEIQELLKDTKKGKHEKEWKDMGLKSVKSKLTKKDNGNYDGKISGKFSSLSMLCWKGDPMREFKMDNKSLHMDFASSDFPSTIIIESKIPILMSNAPSKSENKLMRTWTFAPKQRRLVFIEFQ